MGYSIVALQEANLAYHYPIIYWNAANLISDSGGQSGTVNYDKIAVAVGRLINEGVNISLPDINKARFDFRPYPEENKVIFGLKPISGVGADIANAIVKNQPYTSVEDFYSKMQEYKKSSSDAKFGDTAMIQLIKAGCFDELENKPRTEIMKEFITSISKPIKKLQMSNIEDLKRLNLLTQEELGKEYRYYRYKNYVFSKENIVKKDGKSPATWYYKLDRKYAEPFFFEHFELEMSEGKDYEYTDDGYISVKKGSFDKTFDKLMDDFKKNKLDNEEYLSLVNKERFENLWQEKASGNISKWEMDSLNYYYHPHELANINKKEYNIIDFFDLSVDPEIIEPPQEINPVTGEIYATNKKPRYVLSKICGTVVAKDKNRSTVSLLTESGVVTLKFYKGQFSFYDREISSVNDNGVKTKLENSWFKRGTLLIVTGFRSGEQFIPKKYGDSVYSHTLQLVTDIKDNGEVITRSERVDANEV